MLQASWTLIVNFIGYNDVLRIKVAWYVGQR